MKVGGEEGGTLHRGGSTGKGTEARAPMTAVGSLLRLDGSWYRD